MSRDQERRKQRREQNREQKPETLKVEQMKRGLIREAVKNTRPE